MAADAPSVGPVA